jgi:adenosylcobyric acid synthase
MGQTIRTGGSPFIRIIEQNGRQKEKNDGCITAEKRVMGTYIHGFFDTPEILKQWFSTIGYPLDPAKKVFGLAARDEEYDRLAIHFQENVATKRITQIIQGNTR